MTHFRFESVVENSPFMILTASYLAVLIFFVHSGFVLSWKYLNAPDGRLLISMAARRGFRLGIPIAASVWFAYSLMRLGLMHNKELAAISGSSEFFSSFYDFYPPTFMNALTDSLGGALIIGSVRFNGALWTMPIELFCSYAVFLILPLVVCVKTRYLFIAFAVASISLLGHFHNVVCFLTGIMLVRAYQEGYFGAASRMSRLFNARFSRGLLVMLTIVAIINPIWVGRYIPIPAFLNPVKSVQVVSAVIIVLMVLTNAPAQQILGSRPLKFLGKLSFSAYLLHLPILCSFSSWLFLRLLQTGSGYGLAIIITFLITIPTVYLVAWIMTLSIDRWAINFGKRTLEKYLNGQQRKRDSDLSPSQAQVDAVSSG
jgi:peptidoglycan/LPS O-acetylase OafA/YrhL